MVLVWIKIGIFSFNDEIKENKRRWKSATFICTPCVIRLHLYVSSIFCVSSLCTLKYPPFFNSHSYPFWSIEIKTEENTVNKSFHLFVSCCYHLLLGMCLDVCVCTSCIAHTLLRRGRHCVTQMKRIGWRKNKQEAGEKFFANFPLSSLVFTLDEIYALNLCI